MTRNPDKNQPKRIEPRLDGQQVEFRAPPRAAAVPAWRNRRHWRWTAAALLACVLGLVLLREPLSNWLWSGSRVQSLLEQGDLALRQGKLSAADGSGARQKFEAAQALDNDRSEARAGLARVANAALGQARQAVAAGEYPKALQQLALARELQAPGAQTAAVADELRRRQVASSGLGQWLQRAAVAMGEGRLVDGEDAALPLYQRVLALQPDNTLALEGREDALSDLLQLARVALQQGDLPRGSTLIAAARGYDAGHVELPELLAQLSRERDRQRNKAELALRAGRLPQALVIYRTLHESSEDAAAQEAGTRGFDRVAMAYAARARRHAADFEFDAAAESLRLAREISPQLLEVKAVAGYLTQVREARARRDLAVTPQVRRQVGQLLRELEQAEARGEWIAPPGDSAYDKLRAAQALAPREPAVVAAGKRLLPATRRCFDAELRANRPRLANACYDAWTSLAQDPMELVAARRQLAAKWVAVGNERLRGGDLAYAREALQSARALDAKAAGLAELQRRVEGVQAP